MNPSIKNLLKALLGGTITVAAHHYGSKILEATQEADRIEELRNKNVIEQVKALEQKFDTVIETVVEKKATQEQAIKTLGKCNEEVTSILENLNASTEATKHSELLKDCIAEMFELFHSSKKNFNSNINLDLFYKYLDSFDEYLDSLTLLEESALVHILMFAFILLILFNLISVLFVNELIQYFNLEDKHPYLNKILMLRAKFQRYYLIWNFMILILICLAALFLNGMVLWLL